MGEAPLAHLFRESARQPVAPVGDEELETLLAGFHRQARDAWPEVDLPAESFVQHVARHLPESGKGRPAERVLGKMALSDLYLACACVEKVPRAAESLERAFMSRLPALLGKGYPKVASAAIDEVCQMLRVKLLCGTDGESPHLRTYSGDGGLISWMVVIGSRMISRSGPARETASPEILDDLPAIGDHEGSLIKDELYRKFRAAVREAASAEMPEEQRHLLELYYAEGLTQTQLAKTFDTNQVAISRRLQRAREGIFVEAARLLRERHGIGQDEMKAFLAALESRFDVTMSQIFGSESESP